MRRMFHEREREEAAEEASCTSALPVTPRAHSSLASTPRGVSSARTGTNSPRGANASQPGDMGGGREREREIYYDMASLFCCAVWFGFLFFFSPSSGDLLRAIRSEL